MPRMPSISSATPLARACSSTRKGPTSPVPPSFNSAATPNHGPRWCHAEAPLDRRHLHCAKRCGRAFAPGRHHGPRPLRVGDGVWLLKGGRTPFILRKRADGQYYMVGETYVHGVMYEEAMTPGVVDGLVRLRYSRGARTSGFLWYSSPRPVPLSMPSQRLARASTAGNTTQDRQPVEGRPAEQAVADEVARARPTGAQAPSPTSLRLSSGSSAPGMPRQPRCSGPPLRSR